MARLTIATLAHRLLLLRAEATHTSTRSTGAGTDGEVIRPFVTENKRNDTGDYKRCRVKRILTVLKGLRPNGRTAGPPGGYADKWLQDPAEDPVTCYQVW